ncbi:MAG TPA: methyltransferase domain-containing protein [Kofleriaceae bacterium]|nr:methyltransferase domain-containing protein [Kofleriaceae bacterium]
MGIELHVWERDGRVERMHVPDEGVTIGRMPQAFGASYCTQNASVSRLHCRVARLGDGWFLEDLGSANGTKVNGELAEGPTPVRVGDVIVIGGLENGLTAQLVDRPEPRPEPRAEVIERASEMTLVDDVPERESETYVTHWQPVDKIRTSYDVVAEKYANELAEGMMARPLERGLMIAFAELVRALGDGVVGDVGCGPGHIAQFLTSLGLHTTGFDVSAAMIEQARVKFPALEFRIGSMLELPVTTAAWLGAIAMWSTLHCDADERSRFYKELARVVRTGGFILHGFYVSAPDQPPGSTYHLQQWFGLKVDLPTYFVAIEDAAAEMDKGGFEVAAALVREPMHANELPARRCYMLGKRR